MEKCVGFPKSPMTPINVSFMICKESRSFLGSFEHKPKKNDVIAFIPYLDLPHYALDEERAIAFIDKDGFRGWIAKDDVSANFDAMSHEHEECSNFLSVFERNGWEAIPILWYSIDWKKHFTLRNDDESYDLTPNAFFNGSKLVSSCEWCGHPQLNSKFGKPIEDFCEACKWSGKDEMKDAEIRKNTPIVQMDPSKDFDWSGWE
jgi:hypothetical protein